VENSKGQVQDRGGLGEKVGETKWGVISGERRNLRHVEMVLRVEEKSKLKSNVKNMWKNSERDLRIGFVGFGE
jgi:hypothetical protein